MPFIRRIQPFHLVFLLILLAAAYLRASGLFRGLADDLVVHPDARKQVLMLEHYLHGEPVVYQNNIFYDGYPYGLNQVDAWAIRLARSAGGALRSIVDPDGAPRPVPARHELFFWAHGLRALYGLAAMGLVFAAVLRFSRNRWAALAAAALYGLAPLAAAVAHAATGDIGVDLFIAAALYGAAAFADGGRLRWLVASAVASGMAFACKYQGLLGLWIGLLPLLPGLCPAIPAWKRVRAGLALAAGAGAGAVALNPAFFVDPAKTWRNMWLNFAFLKDYGVSREFLEQPFFVRMRWGLGHNVPFVAGCIGWGLMALGLLALLMAIRTLWREMRMKSADPETRGSERRHAAVFAAVASFPWVALFLATALKPEVQPFHFTFLLPALAAASGLLLATSRANPGRAGRLALAALAVAAGAESSMASRREDFFWSRPDIHLSAFRYSETVFGTPGHGTRRLASRHVIKTFYIEPATLPVFRNRPCALKHADVDAWRRLAQVPGPAIPFPGGGQWIFLNGPVFPRNDRMFAVPASGRGQAARTGYDGQPLVLPAPDRAGVWTERALVFNREPEGVRIGLRTGRWPARYEIRASGEKPIRGFLAPHSQVLLPLPRLRARFSFPAAGAKKPETHIATLRMRAQLGPVWATVLASPEETARYLRHGPPPGNAAPADAPVPDWGDATVQRLLRPLRFADGDVALEVSEKPQTLPGGIPPLEAGAYVWTARVRNPGPARRLRLELADPSGLDRAPPPFETEIATGEQQVVWRFTKEFAPYDAELRASADAPGGVIESWSLAPDLEAQAAWRPASPAVSAPLPGGGAETALDVRFPGVGTWRGLWAPPGDIPAGQGFRFATRFDLDERIAHPDFHELQVFLHLWNAQGERVATLDHPLSQASFSPADLNWQAAGPFPPGPYTLEGGVFNLRTGLRKRFIAPPDVLADPRRRHFYIQEWVVRKPDAAAPKD